MLRQTTHRRRQRSILLPEIVDRRCFWFTAARPPARGVQTVHMAISRPSLLPSCRAMALFRPQLSKVHKRAPDKLRITPKLRDRSSLGAICPIERKGFTTPRSRGPGQGWCSTDGRYRRTFRKSCFCIDPVCRPARNSGERESANRRTRCMRQSWSDSRRTGCA